MNRSIRHSSWLVLLTALVVPSPSRAEAAPASDAAESNVSSSSQTSDQSTPPIPEELRKERARQLGTEGIELYDAGQYEPASEKLEGAYNLLQVPTLGLWSARALSKTGRLLEAWNRYQAVLAMPTTPDEPAVFTEARSLSAQELEWLEPRIPTIAVQVRGVPLEDVVVTLNDSPVASSALTEPLRVDPGTHRIEGTHGAEVERVTLALPERARGTAILDFSSTTPVATPAPAGPVESDTMTERSGLDRSTWATIAYAAGGASLVTGVVFTAIASGKQSDLETNCPDRQCEPEFHDDVDSLDTALTVSLIGYLGAVVGGGLGTYLLLSDEAEASRAAPPGANWSMWLGPRSAGVRGRF